MDNDLHDRTFTLEVYGIDRELSLALVTRAANDGILIQELVHRILRDELLPDIPAPIVSAGRQTAEEFVRGGRTLEEIDDPLYGPQLREAAKLVDTQAEVDINKLAENIYSGQSVTVDEYANATAYVDDLLALANFEGWTDDLSGD